MMADTDDLKAHEEMWNLFIKLMMFSSVGIIIVLVLMAIFLL
jgi:hypothetical protein